MPRIPIPVHHVITPEDRHHFRAKFNCEPFQFWDIHTGFDTIAFEDRCFPKLPNGTSCKDAVEAMGDSRLTRIVMRLVRGEAMTAYGRKAIAEEETPAADEITPDIDVIEQKRLARNAARREQYAKNKSKPNEN